MDLGQRRLQEAGCMHVLLVRSSGIDDARNVRQASAVISVDQSVILTSGRLQSFSRRKNDEARNYFHNLFGK